MPAYERPECPEHDINLTVYRDSHDVLVPHVVTDIPIAPSIDEIPEFHDCQRLVRTGTPEYGPLVGVFASERIDSLFGTFRPDGAPADLRAIAVLNRTRPAAAQLFNYDDEPYEPLGIHRQFSCLYLMQPEESGGRWRAFMLDAKWDDNRCKEPLGDPAKATELPVAVHDIRTSGGEPLIGKAIPPVARFDMDVTGRQTIGIKCGVAWCSVGTDRPRPSEGAAAAALIASAWPADVPADPAGVRRVTLVPGWHDEQTLALALPASAVGLAPRGPRAVFYPDPAIGGLNEPSAFDEWRTVGYVIAHGPVLRYAEKFNLAPGAVTRLDMLYRGTGAAAPEGLGACSASAGGTWWMRITRAGAEPIYRCVTAREHPSAATLPGTARWRWQLEDETTWVRCPLGCCSTR
ncbi:MAG TPA: hypothetical protein VF037_01090 [Gemmatimonadales bacterium]